MQQRWTELLELIEPGPFQPFSAPMMTVLKALPAELIDRLLADYQKPEDLIGEHGLLKQMDVGHADGVTTIPAAASTS